MVKTTPLIISAFSALFLATCATQTYEPVCKSANWEDLGYKYIQGKANVESGDFYQRVCPNFGYEADIDAFERGYRRGAEKFCTPTRGFENGSSAALNENLCAAVQLDEYDVAYEDGLKAKEIQLTLERLHLRDRQIDSYKRAINGGGHGQNFYGDPVGTKKTIKDLDDERQNIRVLRERYLYELKLIENKY